MSRHNWSKNHNEAMEGLRAIGGEEKSAQDVLANLDDAVNQKMKSNIKDSKDYMEVDGPSDFPSIPIIYNGIPITSFSQIDEIGEFNGAQKDSLKQMFGVDLSTQLRVGVSGSKMFASGDDRSCFEIRKDGEKVMLDVYNNLIVSDPPNPNKKEIEVITRTIIDLSGVKGDGPVLLTSDSALKVSVESIYVGQQYRPDIAGLQDIDGMAVAEKLTKAANISYQYAYNLPQKDVENKEQELNKVLGKSLGSFECLYRDQPELLGGLNSLIEQCKSNGEYKPLFLNAENNGIDFAKLRDGIAAEAHNIGVQKQEKIAQSKDSFCIGVRKIIDDANERDKIGAVARLTNESFSGLCNTGEQKEQLASISTDFAKKCLNAVGEGLSTWESIKVKLSLAVDWLLNKVGISQEHVFDSMSRITTGAIDKEVVKHKFTDDIRAGREGNGPGQQAHI